MEEEKGKIVEAEEKIEETSTTEPKKMKENFTKEPGKPEENSAEKKMNKNGENKNQEKL